MRPNSSIKTLKQQYHTTTRPREVTFKSAPTLVKEFPSSPRTKPTRPTKMEESNQTFAQLVKSRHTTRAFLPDLVPMHLLDSALELARHSPSNSNTQPWRLTIVTGKAHQRLSTALLEVATTGAPNIPPLPQQFSHYRSELGKQVYGEGWGISRDDTEGRRKAVLRNWEFFGAPVVIIVCMDKDLEEADSLSVGMYLQTLLLALTEKGLASGCEVSVAGYKEVVRRELGIDERMNVICGVAVGWEDDGMRVNGVKSPREAVEFTTRWLSE
ncbi:Nitroreductase-like protein [Tricladium varicosporioides]|nr:Nitroreductase-like protein [Hymenoscyphus varicosporioides]